MHSRCATTTSLLETNFEPTRLFANELDYERASLIVTSNKPFSAWGEIFGDETTAVAMIDRLVHHAESLSLKGDS